MNDIQEFMALQTEAIACQALILGMEAENELRKMSGDSPAYGMEHFAQEHNALMRIAAKMRECGNTDSPCPSPESILAFHVQTGEPLTREQVDEIVNVHLCIEEDFEERGGGLFWYLPAFPPKG